MMSDNGYTLDREIAKAVKEYLTINYEKYQNAIKKTGPIDNTSLYRNIRNKREEG
jgi:TPP-dependent 2-oxoacid decarboxylase